MKERFSVSMDEDLTKWLDKLADEKIFSSRSHALEFCVKQISKIGIKNIVLMHWGTGEAEPVFIQKSEVEALDSFAKARSISRGEAVKVLINQGMKDES
ncbi:ribbon-helix-helix domain-containing protein [Methanosarcina sp.]|uniref:ribbon-helix-helix domain-containing protein n=1 Tax=Methanosarcina sp. TaxID=2213 RepID=UPI003BB7B3F7